MEQQWLLLLVFTAIAIGWFLGRRSKTDTHIDEDFNHSDSRYYKGLNYLLNDRPDSSLDAFIEALEVNGDTLETHLAVGNLMRRNGEVDRAIRIHQNLLSRPSISAEYLHQAHLELARDYISAGLLDRAERLLEDLLKEAPELRVVTTGHLLEVYQDEREWEKAIELASKRQPRKFLLSPNRMEDPVLNRALSHYCCELAETLIEKNDYHAARSRLNQADRYDSRCVRASLLRADIESMTGNYSGAIHSLRKVQDQDPVFIPLTLAGLKSCYAALGNEIGFRQYLYESLKKQSTATVVLALAEDIQQRDGDDQAIEFMNYELKKKPTIRGLARLVGLHLESTEGPVQESLFQLQQLIDQLMLNQPLYQCAHCGFSGRQLHWLCPGCKHWGEIKPLRGTKGD